MTAHVCYERDVLTTFLRGELAETDSAEVLAALESCQSCARLMEDVESQSDSLIKALRTDDPDREYLDEPELQSAAVKLQAAALKDTDSVAGHTESVAPEPRNTQPTRIRDYELLSKLGQGGMGTVYKARHSRLKRIVALKVMTTPRLQDPRAVARFEREMEAIGRLDHPNIVRATDAGESDGLHYLVMEYVPGSDVSTLAMLAGPMPVADACEIARQAALGLQHAFEHGQVHRDMKPPNLMLTEDGTVKILDMGLALVAGAASDAEHTGELTGSGQILGTVDYMAPEQAHDTHAVDVRADIYSLGATLYRLLAGASPFAANVYKSTFQRLQALTTKDPPPITEKRDDLPDELVELLTVMLSREPDDRPQQPVDVADALRAFTADADLTALLKKTAEDRAAILSSFGADISLPGSTGRSSLALAQSGLDLTPDTVTNVSATAPTLIFPSTDEAGPGTVSPVGNAARSYATLLTALAALSIAIAIWQPWKSDDTPVDTTAGHRREAPTESGSSGVRPPLPDSTAETVSGPPLAHPQISSDEVRLSSKPLPGRLRFTRQGLLASAGWSIGLWDVTQATQIEWFQHPTLHRKVQGGGIDQIAFSPDGTRFVTSSWSDLGQVHLDIFESPGHKLLHTFSESETERHTSRIQGLDWSLDGSMIVSASWDGTVRLWDAETATHIKTLPGPGVPEHTKFDFARFLADGRVFVHGNVEQSRSQFIWDVEMETHRDITLPGSLWTVDVTPDGRRSICGSYFRGQDRQELTIVDIDTDTATTWASSRPYDVPLREVALSPDGRFALILDAEGKIEYWDLDEDQSVVQFPGVEKKDLPGGLAMSLDGRLGAAAGTDGLRVFRLPEPTDSRPSNGAPAGLVFNGRTSQVDIDIAFDHGRELTVEAWVTPHELPDAHVTILRTPPPDSVLGIGLAIDRGRPMFGVGVDTGWRMATGRISLKPNEHIHIAGVYDAESIRLYLNGKLHGTATSLFPREPQPSPLVMGQPDDDGRRFAGTVDELRVCAAALFAGNSFEPTASFTAHEADLILFHFDDDHPDQLKDSSGKEHHGRIKGATRLLRE